MNIELSNNEKDLLVKILEIQVHNANHVEDKRITIQGEEYRILCNLFNKVRK